MKLTRDQLFDMAQQDGDAATGYVIGEKREGRVFHGRFYFTLNGCAVSVPYDEVGDLIWATTSPAVRIKVTFGL